MASTFTWLDYSERDRQRAIEVVDLFHMPGTVDELGVGSIRDALADLLTPGTSTIQTRARYFLFVPWFFRALESSGVPGPKADEWIRDAEARLMGAVRDSEDAEGLIGIDAGRQVKRLASSVYWAGLWTYGIRLYPGSQTQYFQEIELLRGRRRDLERGDRDEAAPPELLTWHPYLPDPPSEFPTGASMALRREEAEYLQERLRATTEGSLLHWLVDREIPVGGVQFPWELPELPAFPPQLRHRIEQAQRFAEVVQGPRLLYNVMLAEAREWGEKVDDHLGRFEGWLRIVEAHRSEILHWDIEELWKLVFDETRRIPYPTRLFVEGWLELMHGTPDWRDLLRSDAARRLISERELRLKGGRARLRSRRYLELWGGNSGTAPLDFRWGITRTIVTDILTGLRRL